MEISLKSTFAEVGREIRGRSPKQINRAAVRAINKAAQRVRVDSGNEISEQIEPRKGAKRQVKQQIKTVRARGGRLLATVYFNDRGFGIEQTSKAKIRKVRGKGGRYNIAFKGKKIKGFSYGGRGNMFIRSKNRVKRLFSFTLLQEAHKANVFTKAERIALDEAKDEFTRQLKLFS